MQRSVAMRVAALIVLAGCNQIFGLTGDVNVLDAGIEPPSDAAFPTVRLVHLIAQTQVVSPNIKGEPDPVLLRLGIAGADVKIGLVDGPLASARYDGVTGEVVVPPEIFDAPSWRLQYTLGTVLHDVVWTTTRENEPPKLVVPIVGRIDRTTPPTSSGYNLAPSGAPTFRNARVFMAGVFMDILVGTTPSQTLVDGTTNKQISGPLGTPDADVGDSGVLVNYRVFGSCENLADGYAEFMAPPLIANTFAIPLGGALTPLQPTWTTAPMVGANVNVINGGSAGPSFRLLEALDGLADTLDPEIFVHGFVANEQIPQLAQERTVSLLKGGIPTSRRTPGPLMLPLAQCTLGTTIVPNFPLPQGLATLGYPRLTYGMVTNRRAEGGVELVSSLVAISKHDVEDNLSIIDLGVPLASAPTLSDGTNVTSLVAGTDVPAAPSYQLNFALEGNAGSFAGVVDYLEVTVFRVAAALEPIHVYRTANVGRSGDGTLVTPIRIDGTDFIGGGTFVLQLRAARGAPNAATGDFETVAFPQAMSTVFTRTFQIAP